MNCADWIQIFAQVESQKSLSGKWYFSQNNINFFCNNCADSMLISNFPSYLKLQTQRQFLKRKTANVENYHPVSILPDRSKEDEQRIYIQIYEYINEILSKWQCCFHRRYSAQHCLLVMIGKWRQCLNKGGVIGVLLTDLSKGFGSISHVLLIIKLAAYGFDYNSLQMLKSSLSNRKQGTKN